MVVLDFDEFDGIQRVMTEEQVNLEEAIARLVLRDLMELCHWLTRLKVVPEAGDDPSVPEAERRQGGAFQGGNLYQIGGAALDGVEADIQCPVFAASARAAS